MATTYYLTTTAASLDPGAESWSNEVQGSAPSTTTLTSTIANGDGMAGTVDSSDYAFTPAGVPGTDGVTGNYQLRVEISTGDSNVTLIPQLARVNSTGTVQTGPTGSDGGGQTASAGTKTFNWTSLNLGTWAAGDRLRITYGWDNASTHGGAESVIQDIGSAGTDIDAPWSASVTVSPSGIAAAPSFGSAAANPAYTVSPSGISAAASFGTPAAAITFTASPTGLDASASFGSPGVFQAYTVSPTGLDASATIGSAAAASAYTVSPTGLDASATIGSAAAASAYTVSPTGLDASASFGAPSVGGAVTASPSGLDASAAFGSPSIAQAYAVSPSGLNAAASFGSAGITQAHAVSPPSLDASASFGSAGASVGGALSVSPAGLDASASFGAPAASLAITVSPAGVSAAATFGSPAVSQPSPTPTTRPATVGGSGRSSNRRRRSTREDSIAEREWRRAIRERTRRREEADLLAMLAALDML